MAVTLINGDGNQAVYAAQDSDWYASICGETTYIMPVNDKLSASVGDSNTIEIGSGVCISKEGRRIQVDEGDICEIIIPTGTQGVDTYYIIGFHLYIDELGAQVAETFCETMDSEEATITETTFKEGSSSIYISLYRVKREGLSITDVSRICPIADSITSLSDAIGDDDISEVGTSVTNAISALNTDLTGIKDITVNETVIGSYKGATLYRKVFTGTALTDFNHNITNLNSVYKLEGTFKTTQGYYRAFNFTYALNDTSSPAWYAGLIATSTQIQFQAGSNIINDIADWQVTIEYTKSV